MVGVLVGEGVCVGVDVGVPVLVGVTVGTAVCVGGRGCRVGVAVGNWATAVGINVIVAGGMVVGVDGTVIVVQPVNISKSKKNKRVFILPL